MMNWMLGWLIDEVISAAFAGVRRRLAHWAMARMRRKDERRSLARFAAMLGLAVAVSLLVKTEAKGLVVGWLLVVLMFCMTTALKARLATYWVLGKAAG